MEVDKRITARANPFIRWYPLLRAFRVSALHLFALPASVM